MLTQIFWSLHSGKSRALNSYFCIAVVTWNVDWKNDTFSESCENTLRMYLWSECNVSKHCIVCLNERMNPILELGSKNHFNPSRSRLIPLTVPRLYQAVAGTTVHCRIVFFSKSLQQQFVQIQLLLWSDIHWGDQHLLVAMTPERKDEKMGEGIQKWHLRGKKIRTVASDGKED